MKKIAQYIICTISACTYFSQESLAQRVDFTLLDTIPQVILLEDTSLMESSGLAFSRKHNNILYTHEDSKCAHKITAVDLNGKTVASLWLKDIQNRDWEDIAVVRHPNGDNYIYLADIGDNARKYNSVSLYRFLEPKLAQKDITIDKIERLEYQYPEGPLNAEALLFDPINQDFWVVSKEKDSCGVYRLPFTVKKKNADEILYAEKKLTLHIDKITAGDISTDGTHIILRSKPHIYYWTRHKEETIDQNLARHPTILPHKKEHQSEGITFFPDNSGFITSTEVSKKSGLKPYLSMYSLKNPLVSAIR